MDTSDVVMQDAPDNHLDQEIANVREQVRLLNQRRSRLQVALAAARSAERHREERSGHIPVPASPPAAASLDHIKKQTRHEQQCLYRMGAGATMFEVKDPDPYAVDGGRVLGVRIEVCIGGRFQAPYYLLLVRPVPRSPSLRIHKHTVPPAVPLATLVARYLPQPASTSQVSAAHDDVIKPPPRQNLSRLVRALRQELVSYHLRLAFIDTIRDSINSGIPANWSPDGSSQIREISSADADGRDLRVEWFDGRAARIRIGHGGEIENCVVFGEDGRDRWAEREICGGDGRIEGLLERLQTRVPALHDHEESMLSAG